MKKLIAAIFVMAVFSETTSLACLNETRITLNGKKIDGDEITSLELVPWGKDLVKDRNLYIDELSELDSLWKTTRNIDYYSDYGVVLVYLGRYAEAKDVFQKIERMAPGRYSTAANLGTVYELLGDNTQALRWIKKAVAIDPTSHNNSEWLHVKILETKIKGDDFLTSTFLIGTTFGNDVKPVSSMKNVALTKLQEALYYQLNERLTFIKPKDKIVALLLFELGNIYALTTDVTISLRVYDIAKEYGYSSEVFDKRYGLFKRMQKGLGNEYSRDASKNIEADIQTDSAHQLAQHSANQNQSINKPGRNYIYFGIGSICIVIFAIWYAMRQHHNT